MYIYSGRRETGTGIPLNLNDFYVYDLETHHVDKISSDTGNESGPRLDISHIATIDCQLQEIYVLAAQKRSKLGMHGEFVQRGIAGTSHVLWECRPFACYHGQSPISKRKSNITDRKEVHYQHRSPDTPEAISNFRKDI